MNRARSASVESQMQRSRRVTAVASSVLAVLSLSTTCLTGCVAIDGGAAELSWTVRSPEGESSSCDLRGADDEPDIAEVRICWEALEDDGSEFDLRCDRDNSRSFECTVEHGVTGFEIAPGRTALWIEPLCEDSGSLPPPDRYEVPAPIVRTIEDGQVAILNALLIVAAADACRSP